MPGRDIGVRMEITPETSRRLEQLSKNLSEQEFKKFVQRAMRNVSTAVRRDLNDALIDRYRLDAAGGLSKIATMRSRQTVGGREIRFKGSRIPLARFMTDEGERGGKDERPPKVNVLKTDAGMKSGDFYALANVRARVGGASSLHGMIFRPEGGRYQNRYSLGKKVGNTGQGKIKGLMTVSVYNMMGVAEVDAKMRASAGRIASEALARAVDKAFQSAAT